MAARKPSSQHHHLTCCNPTSLEFQTVLYSWYAETCTNSTAGWL